MGTVLGKLGQLVPLESASKGEMQFAEPQPQTRTGECRRVDLGLGDNK